MSSKAERVHGIFSSIAPRYDLVNDVMTGGQARAWRKRLVRMSGARAGMSVLDVATGTGDLAIVFKRAMGNQSQVVGVDFCAEMLEFAPAKARHQGLEVIFRQGDAMALDFPSESFDIVSISYGLRNVSDTTAALKEMARVLKPGGKLMILETGRPEIPVYSQLVDLYTAKVMPFIGGLLSGSHSAYKYLDSSSRDFPYGAALVQLLKEQGGFAKINAVPLLGGVSYIYEASK